MLVIIEAESQGDKLYFNCPECEMQIVCNPGLSIIPVICEHCRTLLPDIDLIAENKKDRIVYHLDKEVF